MGSTTKRTLVWTIASLAAAGSAWGCSDDFNDVGDAPDAEGAGGSGVTDGASGETDSGGAGGGSGGVSTSGSGNDDGSAGRAGSPGAAGIAGSEADSDGTTSSGGTRSSTTTAVATASTTGTLNDPRCDDNLANGDETDVDCGGADCAPCGAGSRCNVNTDCEAVCTDQLCTAASCTDGVRNGTEAATDCGGSCAPCRIGESCNTRADCASQRCVAQQCMEARPELENCSVSPATTVTAYSKQELEELLIGAWLVCPDYADDPAFYEPENSVGVEFTSDYRYTYLFDNDSGELVRGGAAEYLGGWSVDDESGPRLVVTFDVGGNTDEFHPTFTSGPEQVRVPDFGNVFHSARLVPVSLDE